MAYRIAQVQPQTGSEAVQNQFGDQQRARFLPLMDAEDQPPVKTTRIHRIEIYGLFFLAVAGLSATGAVLAYALYFSK